jgi:hypothetical protein
MDTGQGGVYLQEIPKATQKAAPHKLLMGLIQNAKPFIKWIVDFPAFPFIILFPTVRRGRLHVFKHTHMPA